MIDWTKPMQQTFSFYSVNPGSFTNAEKIETITSANINWDWNSETLGSATFETTEDFGECYIRVYLDVVQEGETGRVPLGTFLAQSPSDNFDGMVNTISVDAYTPLIEMKEKLMPIGFTVTTGERIMKYVNILTAEGTRAPVIIADDDISFIPYNFVASMDDTYLSYTAALMKACARRYNIDKLGTISIDPIQDDRAIKESWVFTTDNSSILYPECSVSRDLYGIPNVVEVVYSQNGRVITSTAVNDEPDSPISVGNRGREIMYRDTSPQLNGLVTQDMVDEYAKRLLKSLSNLECTVSFSHGYCPVDCGDAVIIHYPEAGINWQRAVIKSQSLDCSTGCKVSSKATFNRSLYGGGLL